MAARLRFRLFPGALSVAVVACGSPAAQLSGSSELTSASDPTIAAPDAGQAATSASVPAGAAASPTYDCGREGTSREEEVCRRWYCDGKPTQPASWTGSPATCDRGDLDPVAADHALRRINVHRLLAGIEPFTMEAAWTGAAQACALIAHANGRLSHEPPRSSACWSEAGAEISERSLVANVSLVPSVAAYFQDPGNEATMVHRRWLLDETLSNVGFGSTDRYSCVVVAGSRTKASARPTSARGWAAWPPAGPVPLDVFEAEKLDTAGWTVQSTSEELARATVTVSRDGTELPIVATSLTASMGSRSAIRFVPQGWRTEAGRVYTVTVVGPDVRREIVVQPTACGR